MKDVIAYRCTCSDGGIVIVLVGAGEPRIKGTGWTSEGDELVGDLRLERADGTIIIDDITKIEIRRAP